MYKDDIPGLLLLVDFEKVFDTVERSFIEETLEFYGFGPTFNKCIKTCYLDIYSTFLNNGHMSEFFTLERVCARVTSCHLTCLLWFLELLSATIKMIKMCPMSW